MKTVSMAHSQPLWQLLTWLQVVSGGMLS